MGPVAPAHQPDDDRKSKNDEQADEPLARYPAPAVARVAAVSPFFTNERRLKDFMWVHMCCIQVPPRAAAWTNNKETLPATDKSFVIPSSHSYVAATCSVITVQGAL